MRSPSPRLSVVTPTHRRPDLLERLLRSLAEQTVPPDEFEAIVIDDASGDETPEVLRRWSDARPSFRSSSFDVGRGPASARNLGVRLAQGDLILFLDDDVEAAPDLLETHLRFHDAAADPLDGLLGRVDWHTSLDITPFMRWLDRSGLQFSYDTWMQPGPIDPPYGAFYTANLSMSRSLFNEVSGFDERFPYPAYEDIELGVATRRTGLPPRVPPRGAGVPHARDRPRDVSATHGQGRRIRRAPRRGAARLPVTPDDTPERWRVPTRWERFRRWMVLKVNARVSTRDDDHVVTRSSAARSRSRIARAPTRPRASPGKDRHGGLARRG